MRILIFLIALSLIAFYFLYLSPKTEGFCSSCLANVYGPTYYTYRYGDPFYSYLHQERQRFSRLSPPDGARGSWMNPSQKEKDDDKKELEDKMNHWMNEFGQPKPLFAHTMAEAACRKNGDCSKVDQGCIKQKLIDDVGRYRYWEPAYAN